MPERLSAPRAHHKLRGIRPEHIAWIFLQTKPARAILPAQYRRHAIVKGGYQRVCLDRHGGESSLPLVRRGIAPVLPDAGNAEQGTILHRKGMRFAVPVAHIKEIHRHDAAAAAIGVAEDGFFGQRFRARVDGLDARARRRVMGNEAPTQIALGRRTCLRMTSYDRQKLRGSPVAAVPIQPRLKRRRRNRVRLPLRATDRS